MSKTYDAISNAIAYMEKTCSDPDLDYAEMMKPLRAAVAASDPNNFRESDLSQLDGNFYILRCVNPVLYLSQHDGLYRPIATFWKQPGDIGVAETNCTMLVFGHLMLEALQCAADADLLANAESDERFTITEKWLPRLEELFPLPNGRKHNAGYLASQRLVLLGLPAKLRDLALKATEGGTL